MLKGRSVQSVLDGVLLISVALMLTWGISATTAVFRSKSLAIDPIASSFWRMPRTLSDVQFVSRGTLDDIVPPFRIERFGWPFRCWQFAWSERSKDSIGYGLYSQVSVHRGLVPFRCQSTRRPVRAIPTEPIMLGLLLNVAVYSVTLLVCSGVMYAIRRFQRRCRLGSSKCACCGYDQTGLGASRCPECGEDPRSHASKAKDRKSVV